MANMTTVTLLFTDLVGSTEILDRLGDDAAEALRRRHFAILREAVTAQGGQEVKNLGDGLMVVFRSAVDAVGARSPCSAPSSATTPATRVRASRCASACTSASRSATKTTTSACRSWSRERLCGRAGAGQIIASEPVRELAVGSRRCTSSVRSAPWS